MHVRVHTFIHTYTFKDLNIYIYNGLKIFQTPVSEKFLKSRSLNHHITEINYDT